MSRNLFHRLTRSASRVFGGRKPSPRRPRSQPPHLEALETRQLLACNPGIVNRTLLANCDNTSNTLTVRAVGLGISIGWSGGARSFGGADFDSIRLNMGTGNDVGTIYSLPANKPTTYDGGGGLDHVHFNTVGQPESRSPLTFYNTGVGGSNVITVTQATGLTPPTATLDNNGTGVGRLSGLTPQPISFIYAQTRQFIVRAQYFNGQFPFNVKATGTSTHLFLWHGNVTVGDNGSVQAIRGSLEVVREASVYAPPNAAVNLTVNASQDGFRTMTQDTITNVNGTGDVIWDLAPAPMVFVHGGRGGSAVQLPQGNVTVNVRATSNRTLLFSNSPATTITVGDQGNTQRIRSNLHVDRGSAQAQLIVNDSADTTRRTLSFATGFDNERRIQGLSPAEIRYGNGALSNLTIHTGTGGVDTVVPATFQPTTLVGRGLLDLVTVGTTSRGVNDIHAALTVRNDQGSVLLTVDDRGTVADRTAIFDTFTPAGDTIYGRITNLAPASINFRHQGLAFAIVRGGSGHDTYGVWATGPRDLILNTGGGRDSVSIGNLAIGLRDVQGQVSVDGEAGSGRLTLYDNGSAEAQTYVVTPDRIDRPDRPSVGYRNVNELFFGGGSGDDRYVVSRTHSGVAVHIFGNDGTDVLVGPEADSTWNISGADRGNLTSTALGSPVNFQGVEALIGGSGADRFVFANNAIFTGYLDGGAGRNVLDFFASQAGVTVLMPLGLASHVGAFANVQDAIGGQGDNLLVGDDQDNLLYGNDGRDVLIGGRGADSLAPGPGEDLVIGGYTDFDYDIDALLTISSVWSLTDSDYATRIDLLTAGYEGIPVLSVATVHDDYAGNQLAGNSGLDWFFAGAADVLEDLEEGERVDYVF